MSIEFFIASHSFDCRTDSFHSFGKNLLKRDFTDKAVQAHSAICFRIPVGWQSMISTGSVISRAFGSHRTQKYGTGIRYPPGNFHIALSFYNQMLRSVLISEGQCLIHIVDKNKPAVFQRLPCNIATRQTAKLALSLQMHFFQQAFRRRDQYNLTVAAVLCLRKQIGGYEYRISRIVCQDQHFGRTGRHIDSHILQADQLFGSGNIPGSGTKYFIYLRYAFGTVCHRRNCLRSSYFIYLVYARQSGGVKNSRMNLPACIRRSAKNNFFTTRNAGGNSQHQYGGEQRSRPSRYIKSHFLNSYRFLPTSNSRHCFYLFPIKTLGRMKRSEERRVGKECRSRWSPYH